MNRDIPRWLPMSLLGGALLVLCHPLLTGEALFWGLPSLQFFPWRQLAFEELGAGRLPAWNPYLGAGAPLLANYQTAVFYPPNWLWLALPDPLAMNLVALAHVLWAGAGMWVFSGALGLSRFGRGMSTLAYGLGGYLIARLGSFPTADAGAWIPWLFWLVQRVLVRRDPRDVGWLGLAVGMQLLAGHAQTAWYTAVGLSLFALWMSLWARRADPARVRLTGLVLAGVGLALGVALAAVQLVPTAELLLESDRSSGLDFDTAANLSYSPFRLVTLFSPNFYGTPADGSYLTEGIYFEDAAYIGFIPMVAALAAIVGWWRKRRRVADFPVFQSVPFWALLGLGALLIATGRYGPVFRPLYEHVPTFDAFREPVRWLILTVFSLAILAGIGVEHWGRGKWVAFWSRLAAAGGAGAVVVALIAQRTLDIESENLDVLTQGFIVLGCWITAAGLFTLVQPQPGQRWLADPGLWRAAVLLFVAVDLAWAADGLNPTVPASFYDPLPENAAELPPGRVYWFADEEYDVTFGRDAERDGDEDATDDTRPAVEGYFDVADYRIAVTRQDELRRSRLPNLTMLDGIPTLSNNEPMLVGYHSRYVDLIERGGPTTTDLLRAAAVTTLVGGAPTGWPGDPLFTASAPGVYVWLVPAAVWPGSDAAIEAALLDPAWDPARAVILAAAGEADPAATDSVSGTVTIEKAAPGDVRLHVTSERAAFLVISQTWYPGWEATIDGESVPLRRANLAFQALAVSEGESDVRLCYKPRGEEARTGISLAALLLIAGLLGMRRLQRVIEKLFGPPPGPPSVE